ncbi:MAG: signal peptidase II [Agathobacter sp.]|nr:signal peptidase II [Agathobacter sp.]
MQKKNKKTLLFSGILVLVLIVLDQFTKYCAVLFLKNKPAIPIIKDVFELQYLENTSAAFGMDPISLLHGIFQFDIFVQNPELYLNVRMGFFYLLTILMILIFVWVYIKIPQNKRMLYLDLILVFLTAGAIGNLIDRMSQQYVVDFLYFKLIDFPIFNVADIYVTCAAIALLVLGIFYYKDEDIEMIFPSKKDKKER